MKTADRRLAVEYRAVDALVPYARNSRTHDEGQVAQIAGSIREFGFTNPVLIDETGGIIAGHGRVMAARKLGLDSVPCIRLGHLTEAQRRAYVIADNKLALNAGWDMAMLSSELLELDSGAFDMGLLGFSEQELEQILTWAPDVVKHGLTDEDEAPEAEESAVSVPGDVWVMGKHRITCGNSTVATDVERVLAGVKPHLMVTDPPYGVEYDANFRNGIKRADSSIVSARAVGKVLNDDRADWSEAWSLFPGDVAYVWCASLHIHEVAYSLQASGFALRSSIICAKSQFAIGRGDYHWQHEPCWYAVREGKTGHWAGDRKQTTLWQIPKPQKSETGHSTQKPVECMRRPIENNSNPGQAVYEPFSGSGTTIIAAEQTGRVCYAIELHPAYVDVAVKRWQSFTGKRATLEGDGRTFDELSAERLKQAA